MTTTPADSTATPSTGELDEGDPATLIIDLIVRHDARLDADSCASFAEHGVLVPVSAARPADGSLRVRRHGRRD